MLPSLYGEKADSLVELEDKLRNEDKGSRETPIVLLIRFFGNASKHYTTSTPICGVPNGLSRWGVTSGRCNKGCSVEYESTINVNAGLMFIISTKNEGQAIS